MPVRVWMWAATLAVIVAMLAVDLPAHHRAGADTTRRAAPWSVATVPGFVGLKMLLADLIHIPIMISLVVIAACLSIAGGASLRGRPDKAAPRKTQEQPRARVPAHD